MVEKWLCQVESSMLKSMRVIISDCIKGYATTERAEWISAWPGQIILCVDMIQWTTDATIAIENNYLPSFYEECEENIAVCVKLITTKLKPYIAITVESMIVVDVHGWFCLHMDLRIRASLCFRNAFDQRQKFEYLLLSM